MENLYRIFEHELAVSQNLPYKSIFQLEPFRGYLFEEFKAAELKPCNWLYQEEYYSQDEYEKIRRHERMQDEKNAISWSGSGSIPVMATTFYPSEYSIILHQIEIEFLDKIRKNTLDSKFFCPDILKTPTALILIDIEKEHKRLKRLKFKLKRTELCAEEIAKALKSISKADLRSKIIEMVINVDLNYFVDDDSVLSNEWGYVKDEFNKLLRKELQIKENSIPVNPISIPELKDNSELKQKAYDILVVLSGNWLNGEKIMTDEQFTTVVEAVNHLIESGEVKPIDKKNMIQTPATMAFIRKLFWSIHKELYTTTRIKKTFIDFLHAYFQCFEDPEPNTTKEHFSEYKGNFEAHYKKVSDSIKKRLAGFVRV